VPQQRQHQWHIVNDYDFHYFSGKGAVQTGTPGRAKEEVIKQEAAPSTRQATQARFSEKERPGQPAFGLSQMQGREYNQIQRNKQIFMDFVKFFVFSIRRTAGIACPLRDSNGNFFTDSGEGKRVGPTRRVPL
jgi:hypothetical protein